MASKMSDVIAPPISASRYLTLRFGTIKKSNANPTLVIKNGRIDKLSVTIPGIPDSSPRDFCATYVEVQRLAPTIIGPKEMTAQ